MNGPELTDPPPCGYGTVDVKIGSPEQFALSGPKSENVIVASAAGLTRPVTVALSDSVPAPSTMLADAVVVIAGCARLTVVKFVPVP